MSLVEKKELNGDEGGRKRPTFMRSKPVNPAKRFAKMRIAEKGRTWSSAVAPVAEAGEQDQNSDLRSLLCGRSLGMLIRSTWTVRG